jgi:hypothetical protein
VLLDPTATRIRGSRPLEARDESLHHLTDPRAPPPRLGGRRLTLRQATRCAPATGWPPPVADAVDPARRRRLGSSLHTVERSGVPRHPARGPAVMRGLQRPRLRCHEARDR